MAQELATTSAECEGLKRRNPEREGPGLRGISECRGA